MIYRVVFEKDAEKFLRKQPPTQQARLLRAIYKLPYEGDIKSMAGHKNFYRLRVGTYRVLYTIENETVTVRVVNIGNRGDVYK